MSERRTKPPRGQLPKRPTITDAEDADQQKAVRDHEKDREGDLEWILSTARGRRWIYDLTHGPLCHVRLQSFFPGDPSSTGLNEGARMVGENLLEEIRSKHFERWLQMMSENHGD